MPEVPEAGETFYAITDEKTARQLAEKRKLKQQQEHAEHYFQDIAGRSVQADTGSKSRIFNLIVKADVQGTVEALQNSRSRSCP